MKLSKYNAIKSTSNETIILNSRSNGILSLNKEYSEKLKLIEKGEYKKFPDLESGLRHGGMLIDDQRDEYAEVMIESRIARFSNQSLSLTIAPTLACNFRCPYCYEKGRASSTMSEEVEDQLISFIANRYPKINNIDINWYGGEPLLCVSKIERLTSRIKSVVKTTCGYSSGIVTNGYLLTRAVAQRLAACDIKYAQITLDGSKASHDSRRIPADGAPTYERILANICACNDILDINIRVNIDKTNIDDADELLQYLERAGLKNKVGFYLAPVDDINKVCSNNNHCMSIREFSQEEVIFYKWAIDSGFKMQQFAERNPNICCAVSLNAYVIDPLGNLYKCWDDIGYADRAVGTLEEGPVMNEKMLKWLGYEPDDIECHDCFAMPICMGGCPNHAMNGHKKQCVSLRFNVEQKLLLAKLSRDLDRRFSAGI